jgi:hypothetical protein
MFGKVSSKRRDVTLYTSLPPKTDRFFLGRNIGADYQRACIDSWRQMGFDVVSLNHSSEIHALSDAGYEVTYHEVTSKRPRIMDFVEAIRESAAPVAGIINADCLLVGNDGTMESMLKAAETGLVLMERINLRAEDAKVADQKCCGFDFLCFATGPLNLLKIDDDMSIGTPWWDYWFPLAYQEAGSPLFAMIAPILMHLDHPQNWSWEAWFSRGRQMHKAISAYSSAVEILTVVGSHQHEHLSEDELYSFAIKTFRWLKESASVLEVDDPSASLLLSFLSMIDQGGRDIYEQERLLAQKNAVIEQRNIELAAQRAILNERERTLGERNAKLRSIEESRVWRWTRPVRKAAEYFSADRDGRKILREG